MNNNILSIMQALTQNPMQTVMSYGFNIPQNISNNPQAIVQHLLNTGQVSQDRVNQAIQQQNNPMFRKMFGGA